MPALDLTIQKSKHWLKASSLHSAVHFRGSLCARSTLIKSYWRTSKKTLHFLGTPKCRGMGALSPPLQGVNVCCLWPPQSHNHFPTPPLKPIVTNSLLLSRCLKWKLWSKPLYSTSSYLFYTVCSDFVQNIHLHPFRLIQYFPPSIQLARWSFSCENLQPGHTSNTQGDTKHLVVIT